MSLKVCNSIVSRDELTEAPQAVTDWMFKDTRCNMMLL